MCEAHNYSPPSETLIYHFFRYPYRAVVSYVFCHVGIVIQKRLIDHLEMQFFIFVGGIHFKSMRPNIKILLENTAWKSFKIRAELGITG